MRSLGKLSFQLHAIFKSLICLTVRSGNYQAGMRYARLEGSRDAVMTK
jgi:hypothetical protein